MIINYKKLIAKHQKALDNEADEKKKLWWEKYMKNTICFRGVSIPKNRSLLAQWRITNGIDKLPFEKQFDLALEFFNEPLAEDKIAGILFIQNFLYDKLSWELLVNKYEEIYENKLIYDWNICDWFCVRVLSPTIKINGEECAKAILSWKDKEYLWQARSSVVPFIAFASESIYYPYIEEACNVLINRRERFAKTAVGWILHDISKYDEEFVISFVENNLASFSKESLVNSLKYFDKVTKNNYLQKLKETL